MKINSIDIYLDYCGLFNLNLHMGYSTCFTGFDLFHMDSCGLFNLNFLGL